MLTYNLALIGFGGVNRALTELIRDRSPQLEARLGFRLRIVAISDLVLGTVLHEDGVDPAAALAVPRGASFAELPGGTTAPDNRAAITFAPVDIVVEATFTNPGDGEPAASHVRWALAAGKSVTTTNKGPVALHGAELAALAVANGAHFEFEGAVLSGTPVLRFADRLLAGLQVTGFEGILNGTSNYVLGRMERGLALDDAVAEAQQLGYAEADPSADIGGSDVRLKVVILANEVLGAHLTTSDVDTTGIAGITPAQIEQAAADGRTWKLIGSARRRSDGTIDAVVRPEALPTEHPLAGVSGPTNAVSFSTDLLGAVTVSGPGAGRVETAYALLSDIIAIDASISRNETARV